jgi:parallel beta-helix repeat protein
MNKKTVLAFVFVGLISICAVHEAKSQSDGAIFINADGSIIGTNKIQRNGNLYSLTDNIYDSPLVVQCNNIVIDGAGYALQGTGGWPTPAAINLTCSNVIIQNFNIMDWEVGILGAYNSNSISNNNITKCGRGIAIYADYYSITGNYITSNTYGIRIKGNNNSISENHILNNSIGFWISSSAENTITANSIEIHDEIAIDTDYGGFTVYHNNFINNNLRNPIFLTAYPTNASEVTLPPWDNGFPSGGNYWSDYTNKYPNATEIDGLGISNTPYVISINPNVADRYPLVAPFNISETITASSPDHPSTILQSPSPLPSVSQQPMQTSEAKAPSSLSSELAIAVAATLAVVTVSVAVLALKRRSSHSAERND